MGDNDVTLGAWELYAACCKVDPELFFDTALVEEAQAICSSCPVRRECLEDALAHPEQHGVWGGTTARERRRMLADRRRQGVVPLRRGSVRHLRSAG
jgi:WhiB family transcriptional regulator, redox-sensing transcriptional regulator